MKTSAVPTLLPPKEAAAALGLSPGTLANWRSAGGGPTFIYVSGNRVRYAADDLARWLDSRRRRSTSDPGPGDDR